MLETATGLKVSFKTVDQAFTRLKITHKKNVCRQRAQRDVADGVLNDLAPYLQQPERLVFLDGSGFNPAMTRGSARAPSTERATCPVVRTDGKNHTLDLCAEPGGAAGPAGHRGCSERCILRVVRAKSAGSNPVPRTGGDGQPVLTPLGIHPDTH